jgi:hypothetical protein
VQEPENTSNQMERTEVVILPQPTAWPMVLAFGITLVMAGLVTHVAVTVVGLILAVAAAVGWFRCVLPHEHHEAVRVKVPVKAAAAPRSLTEPHAQLHRRVEPVNTFSFVAGVEGGLAGGLAMTFPATIFSFIKYHSIWYAINLLAAGGFVSWSHASDAFLSQFHLIGLVAALGIHITLSLLVGLLYAAMLPMFPRWPIITAGFMAPLLWTGLAYSVMNIVSPILNERIDWWWFVPSQVAFGLVAGFVVNLRVRVRSEEFQSLPFATRAGLHSDRQRRRPKTKRGGNQ